MSGLVVTLLLVAASSAAVSLPPLRWLHAEGRRKVMHVGLGLVGAGFAWLFTSPAWVLLTGGLFTAMMLVRRTRAARRLWPRGCHRLERRLGGRGRNGRRSFGDAAFAGGITLTWLAVHLAGASMAVHVAAVLTLALADPAATAVGRRTCSPRLATGKSLYGSMTFAAAAVCVLVACGVTPWAALPAAVVEALTPRGLDNLTVPLTVVAVALLV